MDKINDGGQAFPGMGVIGHERKSTFYYSEGHPGHEIIGNLPGMSIRDYFAAKAMQGMASRERGLGYEYESMAAYKYADAMLAEREKQK